MADPLVFSSSSLTTLLRCGQQWKFGYVDRIKSPPNIRALIGTATHEAAEVNMRQKITSKVDLPVDDLLDAYATRFDAEAPLIESPQEPVPAAKDSGAKLVKLYHREVAPAIDPVAVEKPGKFQIDGREYSTVIDLLDQKPRGVRVNELKTSMRTNDGSQHMFQLIGSALAYRQDTGEVEEGLRMDLLVRTQKPKVHVVNWGPLSPASIRVFANQIKYANRLATEGLFMANGIQNGSCSWCGYTAQCPAYRAAYGSKRP